MIGGIESKVVALVLVSMLMVALNYSESQATQIAALIMAGSSIICYVLGEGLADSGHYGEDGEK